MPPLREIDELERPGQATALIAWQIHQLPLHIGQPDRPPGPSFRCAASRTVGHTDSSIEILSILLSLYM